MKKVIVVLMLVVFCLVPVTGLANDAIPIIDKDKNLSITVELKSRNAEIGGTLDFTVRLSNNTSNPITDWHILRIFSNDYVSDDVSSAFNSHADSTIEPYETIVWDVSEPISPSIFFYEKDGLFYTDFQFRIEYELEDADGHRSNYYYTTEKIPIRLTNLNHGAHFLNTVSVESEDAIYLGNTYYSDYESSISYVEGEVHSYISVASTSGFTLSNLIIRNENEEFMLIDSLGSQEVITTELRYTYYLNKSKIPLTLPLDFTIIFMLQDNYYAVYNTKNIPAREIDMPQLELTLTPVEGSQNRYSLSVKNVSDRDYTDFYFDGEVSGSFNADNLIEKLESNQTFSASSFDINNMRFIYGYIIDDKLFVWSVSYYKDTADNEPEEIDILYFMEPIDYIDGRLVLEKDEPSPTPSPSPSRTPGPSRTPVPKPTPLSVNTPKPAPSPTITPSPTRATSPKPTASVTVNSVKVIPAVPVWVWIALGGALLVTGILSVLLYIRRSRKEED